MKPLLQASLVNDPFGDPALYLDFLHARRALLFDLGDLRALPARKILRITDVFVTHCHMDHFMGFDWLLRLCLGRDARIRLFGPPGFLDQVEHRLLGYTWNLVENYDAALELLVHEVAPDGGSRALFRCQSAFRREQQQPFHCAGGVLLDEEAFQVRCAFLDHKTPCLAYAVEEKLHVNVWKNRLEAMGLGVGPWLQALKRMVLAGRPDETPVTARWREGRAWREATLPLGRLKAEALSLAPGQKIAYVTDALCSPANAERIVALASGADWLFIEAPFLHELVERAARKYHLTARQAGGLARAAAAKRLVPFHFSPIHRGEQSRLRGELAEAFGGPVLA